MCLVNTRTLHAQLAQSVAIAGCAVVASTVDLQSLQAVRNGLCGVQYP